MATPKKEFKARGPYTISRPTIQQPDDPTYRLIPLTKGLVTKVSTHRYEFLSRWNWMAERAGQGLIYAARRERVNGKPTSIRMHRVIMGLDQGRDILVDHANGETLDNRDENLRICTQRENMLNRRVKNGTYSGIKGVSYDKRNGNWQAHIHLGSYKTLEEAREVRRKAAEVLHGKFYREK